jgi:hypothetical protein
MGYIPPRPQRVGESDAQYIAYLEARLYSFKATHGMIVALAVGLAVGVLSLWAGLLR